MSAEVLKFPNKPLRGYAASPLLEKRYYCVGCESERFFITVKHDIACSSCGAIVCNLRVEKR